METNWFKFWGILKAIFKRNRFGPQAVLAIGTTTGKIILALNGEILSESEVSWFIFFFQKGWKRWIKRL